MVVVENMKNTHKISSHKALSSLQQEVVIPLFFEKGDVVMTIFLYKADIAIITFDFWSAIL